MGDHIRRDKKIFIDYISNLNPYVIKQLYGDQIPDSKQLDMANHIENLTKLYLDGKTDYPSQIVIILRKCFYYYFNISDIYKYRYSDFRADNYWTYLFNTYGDDFGQYPKNLDLPLYISSNSIRDVNRVLLVFISKNILFDSSWVKLIKTVEMAKIVEQFPQFPQFSRTDRQDNYFYIRRIRVPEVAEYFRSKFNRTSDDGDEMLLKHYLIKMNKPMIMWISQYLKSFHNIDDILNIKNFDLEVTKMLVEKNAKLNHEALIACIDVETAKYLMLQYLDKYNTIDVGRLISTYLLESDDKPRQELSYASKPILKQCMQVLIYYCKFFRGFKRESIESATRLIQDIDNDIGLVDYIEGWEDLMYQIIINIPPIKELKTHALQLRPKLHEGLYRPGLYFSHEALDEARIKSQWEEFKCASDKENMYIKKYAEFKSLMESINNFNNYIREYKEKYGDRYIKLKQKIASIIIENRDLFSSRFARNIMFRHGDKYTDKYTIVDFNKLIQFMSNFEISKAFNKIDEYRTRQFFIVPSPVPHVIEPKMPKPAIETVYKHPPPGRPHEIENFGEKQLNEEIKLYINLIELKINNRSLIEAIKKLSDLKRQIPPRIIEEYHKLITKLPIVVKRIKPTLFGDNLVLADEYIKKLEAQVVEKHTTEITHSPVNTRSEARERISTLKELLNTGDLPLKKYGEMLEENIKSQGRATRKRLMLTLKFLLDQAPESVKYKYLYDLKNYTNDQVNGENLDKMVRIKIIRSSPITLCNDYISITKHHKD